jgi:RNA polymerase sigma-70 factor (ECF subfamily)
VRGFGAFYRDYLPQLLALLMIEGARPAVAAELAQDVMSAAYREWARIEKPREWTRQRALAAWMDRREDGNIDD